jgi:putative (di)nucleoside polyphosphate hydrolase
MSHGKLRKNVLAVIFDQDSNVLIVSRVNDPLHWQFPQGGVNENESNEEAIIRELGEELGTTDFTILDQCPEKHTFYFPKRLIRDENLGQEQTIILLKFNGGTRNLRVDKRELGGFLWVSQEQIEKFLHEYRKPVWHIVMKYFTKDKIKSLLDK